MWTERDLMLTEKLLVERWPYVDRNMTLSWQMTICWQRHYLKLTDDHMLTETWQRHDLKLTDDHMLTETWH